MTSELFIFNQNLICFDTAVIIKSIDIYFQILNNNKTSILFISTLQTEFTLHLKISEEYN